MKFATLCFALVGCRFLVVANGIAAVYSLLQLLRCVMGSMKGSVLLNKPLAWAIFSGDQVSESIYCVSFFHTIIVVITSEVGVRFGFVVFDLSRSAQRHIREK